MCLFVFFSSSREKKTNKHNPYLDLRVPFLISEFPYKCGNRLRVLIFSQGKWELLGLPIYLVILEKKTNKHNPYLDLRVPFSISEFPFRCGNRLRVLIFSQGNWELLELPIYLVILEKKTNKHNLYLDSKSPFRCGNRLRVLIFSQGKWELLGLPIYLVILEKKTNKHNPYFDLKIPFSISEFPFRCGNRLRVLIFSQGKWELLGLPIYLVILEKKTNKHNLYLDSEFPFRCENRLRVLIFSQGNWELLELPIYLVILEKKTNKHNPYLDLKQLEYRRYGVKVSFFPKKLESRRYGASKNGVFLNIMSLLASHLRSCHPLKGTHANSL